MATVIRLQRGGRKKRPFYSIIVTDERKRRDCAAIEKLGYYNPCCEPEEIKIDLARAESWTSQGAKVSDRVASLIRKAQAA
ncbi:MAG: 30S ribosomal protein S16 [Mariprofundales bacterium]|nr:30S ribosomal protein S16 [Mariprofundales bacterium]